MKKKNIVKIILLIIIILLVAGFFIYRNAKQEAKEYEIMQIPSEEYAYFVYKQENKYGVIDKEGNIVVQAQFTNVKIPNPLKSVFVCYDGDNTKVLNEKNETLYENFNNIEPLTLKNVSTDLIYEKTVLKYEENGKYGLISIDGNKITNAKYQEIDTLQYKEGELVVKENDKYGVININGYEIIKPEYDQVKADGYYSSDNKYKDDGYIVSITTDDGYRYGYLNNEGQKILDTKYNDLSRLAYSNKDTIYLLCAENGKYGLYEGAKNIIPNEYQAITYVEDNDFCIVQKGKKYGVVNLEGSMMLQVKYSQIDVNGDYLYVTDENSEKKVYDKKGNLTEINPNLVIQSTKSDDDYKIYIDSSTGKTVYSIYKGDTKLTSENYSYIEYLNEGYFIASNESGKLGIIDSKGNAKVELKYDSIQKIAGTNIIQAIDSTTKMTEIYSKDFIKTYEIANASIENIKDNIIKVYNTEEIKYFDYDGNLLENKVAFPDINLFPKKENGKWGFVGQDGNVVVDYQYDDVTEFNEYGYAGVKKDEKWGVIDKDGNVIVEAVYELNPQDKPSFIGQYYKISFGNGEGYYTK
mgnify:FL=1